jgi:NAD(P)-dependent dehydrogenase (short-subunit alcohol dehydrogenase family)
MEVADFGIDVVSIEPGSHRSGIWPKAEAELRDRRDGSPYRTAYDRGLRIISELRERVPPPDEVAHVIGDALTAGPPRARYRVGKDAFTVELLDALPTALHDRVLRSVLGL